MKALVLAPPPGDGPGPVSAAVPPALTRVAGIAILEDVLRTLAANGVTGVVVTCPQDAGLIRCSAERTCSLTGMELDFLNEPGPSGTAVSAALALPLLGGRFLAVYADVISRQPVQPLLELHERSGAAVTLSLAPSASPWEETVVLTDPEGRVTSLRRHPPPGEALSNLAFSGTLVCESCALGIPGTGRASGLVQDLVSLLPEAGLHAAADTTGGYARRVSTPERLLLACHDAFSGRIRPWYGPEQAVRGRLVEGVLEEGVSVTGFLWTMEGSVVESGSIMENCVVMEGAVVEAGARLRNAIVLPGARVGSVTDCFDKYLSVLGR